MFEIPMSEADASALGLGMSVNEIKSLLCSGLKALHPSDPDGDGDNDTWVYIYDVYPLPPTVIYEIDSSLCGEDFGPYLMRSFTIDPVSRTATFGDAVSVRRETMWVRTTPQTQESDRPEKLWISEAGNRHSEADRAVLHSIETHADSIKQHVTTLGASAPVAPVAYGGGFFPMLQSTRESDLPLLESGEGVTITDVGIIESFTESAGDPTKGTFEMTIIRPGFNTSGSRYYKKEALAEAATKGTFADKKMYIDHPTVREEKELPERSFGRIGAVIKETYLGKDGELRGKAAIVNPQLKETLALFKEQGVLHHVGVSINALGTVKEATVEGRKTQVVEAFTQGKSVDFVTEPGAGGGVALYESGRVVEPVVEVKQGVTAVNEEQAAAILAELAAIKVANEALATQVRESDQRAQNAEARATAQATIAARLAGIAEAELPAISKERISLILEGATDTARLDEVIDAEKAYVKEVAAKLAPVAGARGGVVGLGSRVTEGARDVVAPPVKPSENDALVESMSGMFGGADEAKKLLRAMAG